MCQTQGIHGGIALGHRRSPGARRPGFDSFSMPTSPSSPPATARLLVLWTLGAGPLIGLWDLLGQDLAMARWFGSATGFPYGSHWLFASVLHEGARRVAWALQLGLVLAIWWPAGPLRPSHS
jgi:hypothetical protein